MGMYIAIGDGVGWAASRGVFDCIVEGTRDRFGIEHGACAHQIYSPLDEQGQSFIVLTDVEANCFNVFYHCCEEAMGVFPESNAGKLVRAGHIEGILWNWYEVLRLMRRDSRFQELV